MCHFVFDYNSSVSWSIFTIFVPVERGRNALQFTYFLIDDVITASQYMSQNFTSNS